MAKAYASEAAVNCANLAIQVYGGAGFNEETGMPKLARDARIYTICESTLTTCWIVVYALHPPDYQGVTRIATNGPDEGTSQIQRLIISRHLSALYPA